MSWSRAFHVPIITPEWLDAPHNLRDAGEYIQQLPRAQHERPEWQAAAEMLLAAVEGSGPLMFAETTMRKSVNTGKPALNRHQVARGGGNSPRRHRQRIRRLGVDDALRVGVLNLPPVVWLVLVVEVSDSRYVRRMAVNPGPMSCCLLGSE
jgi:hypothetical protein